MAHEIEDIRKKRRKKRKRQQMKRLIIVSLIIVSSIFIVNTKDKWIPSVNGIIYKIRYSLFDKNEDISIDFEKSNVNQIVALDDKLVLLNDTDTVFYTRDLDVSYTKGHSLSDPIIKTKGDRVLVYDLNGYSCSVFSRSKEVFTLKLDEKIMFINMSDDGFLAAVTASDNNSISLNVYNDKGDKIFYTILNEKIIDVCFSDNSKGCMVSTISSKLGKVITKVYNFSFKKDSANFTVELEDDMVLASCYTLKNTVAMIGNKGYNILKGTTGENKYSFSYDGDIQGYDTTGDETAVVVYNSERRLIQLFIFKGESNTATVSLSSQVKDVHINKSQVYLLTNDSIIKYSLQGNCLKTIKLNTNYNQMTFIDNHIFLLGGTKITRINSDK